MRYTLFYIWLISLPAFGGDQRLINGQKADLKDWPASVRAGGCTSTLVGERTLLIASHCVSNGGKVSLTAKGVKHSATCTHSKLYPSNKTADWSLCLVSDRVEGVSFENLNADAGLVREGDTLLLTGYGCIRPGGGGGNDGIYRIGNTKVIKLPKGNDHDIVTRGGAALCYGDSGGPAFYVSGSTGERRVVGVNSRGNISTTSYLSSLTTETAKAFIEEWAKKSAQRICGVHTDAQGCRK